MVLALTVSGIAAAEFRAGVGKSDIQTSADMWPIDGFTCQHAKSYERFSYEARNSRYARTDRLGY
jgi:hypothetical protein